MDPRAEKLAKLLVEYSTGVQKGDYVQIHGDTVAEELLKAVYREVLKKGAFPVLHLSFQDTGYDYYKATEEQLKTFPKVQMYEARHTDVFIVINGSQNTRELSNIDPQKMVVRKKIVKPLDDWLIKRTRWVVAMYPTNAEAQEANMSLGEFEGFVYKACLRDWAKESENQDKIKKFFDKGKTVKIIAPGTHLTFSIKDRKGTKCDGKFNMPDGEVFYAPQENSAEGKISYTYPAIKGGREVSDIVLVFKKGKVVEAHAAKNEDFLIKTLDTDEGARFIGEFGIGTNDKIQRFIKNILFDEKIGGSIHLALGEAYEESGGRNKSAIHWDMLLDLRKSAGGGEIYLDDKLVQKNGIWVF